MTLLQYNGTTIHEDAEFLNLTDMWRADGRDESKRPSDWIVSKQATELREFIEETDARISGIAFHTRKGGSAGGTTWAYWSLAMAYAKYLSPKFHAWCNEVVRAHMQGRTVAAAPAPAIVSAEMIALAVAEAMKAIIPSLVTLLEARINSAIDERMSRVLVQHDDARTGLVGLRTAREICGQLAYIAKTRAVAKGESIPSERGHAEAELRKHVEYYGLGCSWRNLPETKRGLVMGALSAMTQSANELLRVAHADNQIAPFRTH